MSQDIYTKPGSLVLPVPEKSEPLAQGISQKPLFENAQIMLRQLDVEASCALPKAKVDGDRYYVVLQGGLTVNIPRDNDAEPADGGGCRSLAKEALAYVPRQSDATGWLYAGQAGTSVLEIEIRGPKAAPEHLKLTQGTWLNDQILIINKNEAFAYIPAHHDKTSNHCLLINDDIEVLLSCIEIGGGADVHTHHGENQWTYIMDPKPSKLLHYPMGVQHGGIVDIADRHDLVLIYSPPMGEYLDTP